MEAKDLNGNVICLVFEDDEKVDIAINLLKEHGFDFYFENIGIKNLYLKSKLASLTNDSRKIEDVAGEIIKEELIKLEER